MLISSSLRPNDSGRETDMITYEVAVAVTFSRFLVFLVFSHWVAMCLPRYVLFVVSTDMIYIAVTVAFFRSLVFLFFPIYVVMYLP